ncbi:MAG: S41 family peptidase [Planctomycetota bacterium]
MPTLRLHSILFVIPFLTLTLIAADDPKPEMVAARELMERINPDSLSSAWPAAAELVKLANHPQAKLHVLKAIEPHFSEPSLSATPVRALAAAHAILLLADKPVGNDTIEYKAAAALLAIATNVKLPSEIRQTAAKMPGRFPDLAGNAKFNRDAQSAISAIEDDKVKINLCESMWQLAPSSIISRTLSGIVVRNDANPEVRYLAALTMYELGIYTTLNKQIVAELAAEPTALGDRARLLLKLRNTEKTFRVPNLPVEPANTERGLVATEKPEPDARFLDMLFSMLQLYPDGELITQDEFRARIAAELGLVGYGIGADFNVPPPPVDKDGYTIGDGEAMLHEMLYFIYQFYPDREKLSLQKFYENAALGMTGQLDRFSQFMTMQAMEDLNQSMKGEYFGIGAYVEMENKRFKIVSPIYGSPADKAGLKSGDWITEVDGEKTMEFTISEVVERLKGPRHTPVKIKFYRRGFDAEKVLTIIRDAITIPSVLDQILPGDIGYVRLTTFGSNTADDLKKSIESFQAQKARGLVLDLRMNGGGLLKGAIDVSDLFLPADKLIVYDMGLPNVKPRENYYSSAGHTDLPVVILVDGGSASASEITSGCLKAHQRARLVGEKTYGKGTVQRVIPLQTTEKYAGAGRTPAQLKLTISKYYLPDDVCIHETGVMPDVIAKPDEYKSWQIDEVIKLSNTDILTNYVTDHYAQNADLFNALAMNDGGDWSRYPDFEAFYDRLGTKLSKDEVRRLTRGAVRRRVQDELHKRLVADIQEDRVLQRGIADLFQTQGWDINGVEEYRLFDTAAADAAVADTADDNAIDLDDYAD